MNNTGIAWLRFLRQYGPVSKNDSMYDEHIRKSAKRAGIRSIAFTHPLEEEILGLFGKECPNPTSLILTGTAGDGKSHLCGKVWRLIDGDEAEWGSNEVYYRRRTNIGGRQVTVHIIRDLTALPPHDEQGRYSDRQQLLQQFCNTLSQHETSDVFIIAGNDGQLIECWQRVEQTPEVIRMRALIESLLVEDQRERPGVPLKLFNLSRISSTQLLDLALPAFLSHEGWDSCYAEASSDAVVFGPRCPIRHNYELLKTPLVQLRLRALFQLCDCNDLHIPIRRVLLLLVNAVLGHPDAKDRLLKPSDVRDVIQNGTAAKASLYNNLFGGNLSEARRESLEVFEYLNRFGIGRETSNRIDNILIFGDADENLRPYFDELLRSDVFYGANESYYAAQREYVEGTDETSTSSDTFLAMLVSQRRGLFFKIPAERTDELLLWELTVFKYAGEYLDRVLRVLHAGGRLERPILARLVRGLNRVFVGMLVNTDRELVLATSFSFSSAKVSRMLEDRVSVMPRLTEKVEICLLHGRPHLRVCLSGAIHRELQLNLTRYEFLSRVAEGALPSSFSKECYEDILAFKSQLLASLVERQEDQGRDDSAAMTFRLLSLDDNGNPIEDVIEVAHD